MPYNHIYIYMMSSMVTIILFIDVSPTNLANIILNREWGDITKTPPQLQAHDTNRIRTLKRNCEL